MHATLGAVLERTRLAEGLAVADLELARRLATELTRYGVGILPREFFEGPSGRHLARLACEDIEGIRRMQACFAAREPEDRAPRVLEFSQGRGMPSVVLGLTWPALRFQVLENDPRRRWLWQRVLLGFGIRNVRLLPPGTRLAPGGWDVVLVKDLPPARALELAGSLLAGGGRLLLWQDRDQARGLRRRHLDARARPLRVAEAVALESPPALGRLVAAIESAPDGLDSAGAAA